jgi:serine/threonine protein kinase
MTSSILGWDVPFSTLKFTEALGTCKYGEVFKGMMDETEIVVKTLKPDGGEMSRESFDRELDLLYKLEHPNLVQLQAVTLTSDPTSIILEYIPTSLLDVLNRGELGDEQTTSTALQVARGMAYLHSQGVLHCDLGARNISSSEV